jgi:nitrate reductase delta subunit
VAFGTLRVGAEHAQACARVEAWVRARFRLLPADAVLVSELACALPGCPPLETVIAFWTRDGASRHHHKVFKPVAQVSEDDLPPWWMKDALAVPADFSGDCC